MAIENIPYTDGLTFDRWAAELALQDPQVPNPPREEDWRWWASEVLQFSSLRDKNIPQPRLLSGWREWAAEVRLNVMT